MQKCINAIRTTLNAVSLPARQATQQRRSRYRSGMNDRLWPMAEVTARRQQGHFLG